MRMSHTSHQSNWIKAYITSRDVEDFFTGEFGEGIVDEVRLHRPREGESPHPRYGWLILTDPRHIRTVLGFKAPPRKMTVLGFKAPPRKMRMSHTSHQSIRIKAYNTNRDVEDFFTGEFGEGIVDEVRLHRTREGESPHPRYGWLILTDPRHIRTVLGFKAPLRKMEFGEGIVDEVRLHRAREGESPHPRYGWLILTDHWHIRTVLGFKAPPRKMRMSHTSHQSIWIKAYITSRDVEDFFTGEFHEGIVDEVMLHRPREGESPHPCYGWLILTDPKHIRTVLGFKTPQCECHTQATCPFR
ncbi:hypothetical protein ACLB2K_059344 [Fragaria x ananassa]